MKQTKTETNPKDKKPSAGSQKAVGFTDEEKAAMKSRGDELKAETRRRSSGKNQDGEADLLAKIAEMTEPDRTICTKLHAIIRANASGLSPKTWYGMPAYANEDGKVVCFFRDTQKFHERYITLGFNEQAHLDDGAMWPIAYALTHLTSAGEATIAALIKKAVS